MRTCQFLWHPDFTHPRSLTARLGCVRRSTVLFNISYSGWAPFSVISNVTYQPSSNSPVPSASPDPSAPTPSLSEFVTCPLCGTSMKFGNSPVENILVQHQSSKKCRKLRVARASFRAQILISADEEEQLHIPPARVGNNQLIQDTIRGNRHLGVHPTILDERPSPMRERQPPYAHQRAGQFPPARRIRTTVEPPPPFTLSVHEDEATKGMDGSSEIFS